MKTLNIFCLLAFLFVNTPAFAFDIENGKELHDGNCVRCHTETHYTRADRKVSNYDKLHERVRLCEVMLELMWFDEEVDDVSAYLNQAFYKFSLEK